MLTINNTLDGYLKDVEILGNTMQDEEDLADIRSVGEKVEGQELYEIPVLSCGKNLFNLTNQEVTSDRIRPKFNEITIKQTTLKNLTNKTIIVTIHKEGVYAREHRIASGSSVTINLTNGEKYKQLECLFSNGWSANDIFPTNGITITPGTVATEYEPYVEDKITILSPTPLEKVGDVADRLFRREDGVWCIEKNIGEVVLNGSESWTTISTNDLSLTKLFRLDNIQNVKTLDTPISSKFVGKNVYSVDEEGYYCSENGFRIRVLNTKLPTQDVAGFKTWLSQNQTLVKYQLSTPQFIPLPHDQQVKLRTFANKTNISFLTEIEGTIKAQVPKSLGATVNTHTEQISNLNKELDRVKKLEESTVSTVETESDFTTVEATSNGYFEDVKLEGKTLIASNYIEKTTMYARFKVKPNTDYTYVMTGLETTYFGVFDKLISGTPIKHYERGQINTFNSGNNDEIVIHKSDDYDADNLGGSFLIEGDHTQNPPSYFEGLKSVGDDTDEIVVSSVNENMFLLNTSYCKDNMWFSETGEIVQNIGNNLGVYDKFIKIPSNISCTLSGVIGDNIRLCFYDNKKNFIKRSDLFNNNITFCENTSYIKIGYRPSSVDFNSIQLKIGKTITEYKPHQADKKRLLFYNNETQAWEKPILREWDSIEKHSDGKYYYHQRSGEVVLNGSENWIRSSSPYQTNTKEFTLEYSDAKPLISPNVVICDKFTTNHSLFGQDAEGITIYGTTTRIAIGINSTKLPTQDAEGFKQWLQSNNVTVVYQLAEEKVYECTNIDLITYEGETNYVVNSGVIAPKSILKVHNNISNVVGLLQKKVSLLESNMTKYMITQNRMQLASTYSADSVTFKVDYALCSEEVEYNEDLYNLILNNILVGKDNYDYDKMFTMVLDYASWNQISWEQFDILVGLMDIQHNPPIEEIPTDDEIVEEIPNEIM